MAAGNPLAPQGKQTPGRVAWSIGISEEVSPMDERFVETWAPRMLAVLRIVTALLFLEHGTQTLLGFPPSPNPGPPLLSLLGIRGSSRSSVGCCFCSPPFRSGIAMGQSG